jgi:hypothetical protein
MRFFALLSNTRRIVALFEVRINTFEFAVPASQKTLRLHYRGTLVNILQWYYHHRSTAHEEPWLPIGGSPPVSVYVSSLPHFISSLLVSPLTTSDHLDFGLPTFLFHVIFACGSLLGFCCSALHCT